jgi:hypothetical protein
VVAALVGLGNQVALQRCSQPSTPALHCIARNDLQRCNDQELSGRLTSLGYHPWVLFPLGLAQLVQLLSSSFLAL